MHEGRVHNCFAKRHDPRIGSVARTSYQLENIELNQWTDLGGSLRPNFIFSSEQSFRMNLHDQAFH